MPSSSAIGGGGSVPSRIACRNSMPAMERPAAASAPGSSKEMLRVFFI
jgi:hypothetical protein